MIRVTQSNDWILNKFQDDETQNDVTLLSIISYLLSSKSEIAL